MILLQSLNNVLFKVYMSVWFTYTIALTQYNGNLIFFFLRGLPITHKHGGMAFNYFDVKGLYLMKNGMKYADALL